MTLEDGLATLPKTTPDATRETLEPSRAPSAPPMIDFVHNDGAFIPFSHGPMNCAGRNLAMLELRSVVCALVRRFNIRLLAGWDPSTFDRQYKDYFAAARPQLPVRLETRE